MKIDFMWKDGNSGGTGCPALYAAPGGYVVQGIKLDGETRGQLRQLADDEEGVFVPDNVLERLVDERMAERLEEERREAERRRIEHPEDEG